MDDLRSSRRPRGEPEFEPLLVQEAERGVPLDSLTVVCVVGPDEEVELGEIGRHVTAWEGGGAHRFDPVSILLPEEGAVRCHELVDRVETAGLQPGRYELTAVAETAGRRAGRGTAEFTILPPSAE
jgi:hypothetical protein